jgi:hypothetical protein
MVTTQSIIDIINKMSIEHTGREVVQPIGRTPEVPIQEESADAGLENLQQPKNEAKKIRPMEGGEPTEYRPTEEQPTNTDIVNVPDVRRSTRSTKGIPPEKLTLLTKIYATISEINQTKELVKMKAIEKEILLIFKELKAVMPIMKKDVPEDAQVLRSFIFLVEKFLANGVFDKMKARIVADSAQQDRSLYPQRSSPTVSVHAIMTCLAMAVISGRCIMAKIDVKGAYLQTEMTGSPIFMLIDKKLMKMILEFLPELQKFVTKEGTMYTRLMKALYGCIQSSKLWFE